MSQAFLSHPASLDEVYIILIAKSADRLAFFFLIFYALIANVKKCEDI